MAAPQLYTYQCPNDSTIATSPVRLREPLLCVLCHRWMRFRWAEPLDTDDRRALARRGIVFNLPRKEA